MPLRSDLGLEMYVFCILFSVITLCHCESHFMDDLNHSIGGFAYFPGFGVPERRQKWSFLSTTKYRVSKFM